MDEWDRFRAAFRALDPEVKRKLIDWIEAHMAPTFMENPETSFSMRQHFIDACGEACDITHEQFKGAMLEAGYEPTNPLKRNWQFRIFYGPDVIERLNQRRTPFFRWLMSQRFERSDAVGLLASRIHSDREFPYDAEDVETQREYIAEHGGSPDALEAFDTAWAEFRRQGGQA